MKKKRRSRFRNDRLIVEAFEEGQAVRRIENGFVGMATESECWIMGGDGFCDGLGGNECLFEFDDLRDQRSCQVQKGCRANIEL